MRSSRVPGWKSPCQRREPGLGGISEMTQLRLGRGVVRGCVSLPSASMPPIRRAGTARRRRGWRAATSRRAYLFVPVMLPMVVSFLSGVAPQRLRLRRYGEAHPRDGSHVRRTACNFSASDCWQGTQQLRLHGAC